MNVWCKEILALTATLLTMGTAQADLTAMERAQQFGIGDIRGIAYIPGPAGPEKPVDPYFGADSTALPYFIGSIQTYNPQGQPYHLLDAKYTIYYDSDFYNQDFQRLWGTGSPGQEGRDDLGRYKTELNANFVHLYDWNSDPSLRNHEPFLDYAQSLGMKVTIPVSNSIYQLMCSSNPNDRDTARQRVAQIFRYVYGIGVLRRPMGAPHPAAGVLKIFNEFDVSQCKNAQHVAQVALWWRNLEVTNRIPDQYRLPIIFPVTFGIKNGIAGGAVLDAFNAIISTPGLGLDFWNARVIYATNPFNDGAFMKNWIETDLPAWFASNNIPTDTPVVFTEYGRSSDESNPPDETGQAEWIKGQFQAMWQPKPTSVNFLGTCAFVNQYRFWLQPPEPNFALTDFNQGGGAWNKPATMYVRAEQYLNPNAGERPASWGAKYQVDPQKPRPAYCEVARAYGAQPSAQCP
ncbi:MAG TPA: hypothetical protein VNL74_12490 [Methylococcus sp.]|nr:hypothetical protein [Methylococcus sp.]